MRHERRATRPRHCHTHLLRRLAATHRRGSDLTQCYGDLVTTEFRLPRHGPARPDHPAPHVAGSYQRPSQLTDQSCCASVITELAFGYFGVPDVLQLLGPVGRIFLGVPAAPPAPSWGGMLAEGRQIGIQAPWLPTFPIVGLILVAAGIAILGSGLADVVKQRSQR